MPNREKIFLRPKSFCGSPWMECKKKAFLVQAVFLWHSGTVHFDQDSFGVTGFISVVIQMRSGDNGREKKGPGIIRRDRTNVSLYCGYQLTALTNQCCASFFSVFVIC